MLKGSFPALITPFKESLEIDFKVLENLIEWHIQSGSDGLVLLGTTGEGPTVTAKEFDAVVSRAAQVIQKRIPLIIGTGTNSTDATIERTKRAKALGADIALAVVPYYNKPSDLGCLFHFQKVVSEGGLPVIVYHHPGRTGKTLRTETLVTLLKTPQIIGLKEASEDVNTVVQVLAAHPKALIYSGNDVITEDVLNAGGAGSISVFGNVFPTVWRHVIGLGLANEKVKLHSSFSEFLPLMEATFQEINPVGVKFLLSLMGRCLSHVRLPLCQLELKTKAKIQEELNKYLSRKEVVVG